MKKMIKKWLIVLSVIIAMCATVVTAAETTPSLVADDYSVEAGETIVIPVLIQNNTGVMGMGLNVSYDEDVFDSPSITRGTVLAGGTFNDSITDTTSGEFKVLWSDTSEVTSNGTLFSISLNVKSSAKAGDYSITISNREGDTFNESYDDVALADCVSTISVSEKEVADNRVLKSIEVTKQPIKILYEEGEYFDTDGMEVTATYDDGSTQVVTDYSVDPEWLGESDTEVTIKYFENGTVVSTKLAIEVKAALSTDSMVSSVAVNGYYGVMEYVGFEYITDEETESEVETDIYDVNIVLPEGEEVTAESIFVSTFDENATVSKIAQNEDGNWVIKVYAQNVYFASEYTIKITESADETVITQAKNSAASAAIDNHEKVLEEWLEENILSEELTEEIAAEKIAEYINTIPEVKASGYTFTADDVGIYMFELPVDGDADQPSGTEGTIVFEAYIEDGDNVVGSDLLMIYFSAEEYTGVTNLEIVQNSKKLLDSKRVSLNDTDLKLKEEISAYIANLYAQILKDAGYSVEISADDVTITEYVAPIAGSLDNPNGTDGSYSYTVQINSGKSAEITNEKTLNIDAEEAVIYSIAAVAGANGTISPSGNNSVLKGGEISFTITPATGYKIESILVDQVSVGAVATYKFTNVQASHTIMATFVKADASTGGTSNPSTPSKPSTPNNSKTVAVGEVFSVGDLQYKVTWVGSASTVKLVKITNKNIKTLDIPKEVIYKGKTFYVTEMAVGLCKKFKKLQKVTIGDQIEEIPKNAFYGCKKLKTVKIGMGVIEIGTQAFCGCTALKKVDDWGTITTIGKKAFYGCKKLKSMSFFDVTTIGDSAFMNCSKLDYIYLPDIKKIGKKAFYNCKNIVDVTITSKKLSSVGSKAFGNIKSNAEIYLAEKKFNKYKKLLKGKCPAGVTYSKFEF